ncbi:MAG: four helix bundle protein [Candidatus Uhrbacteria bacterium]
MSDVPIIHNLTALYSFWSDVQIIFPKSKRYSLGIRCDETLLDIIQSVCRAAHSAPEQKLPSLETASTKIDLIKILFRVAKDTKCLANNDYLTLQSQLNEIGKMVGGWIKSLK